ncbi:winged helix-turn-helix domain-containing protein [uncultured Erythrobacter sp.]|uniref:winged helix-turn-helix domain-containing protein n=1 Tax=uncultured Erythrobacter sp. TaxID=263913 RepID=UPI002607186D|nr:winged helix-turn-helix domain-containing protein [uncultured Erythrobacter sp.]
MQQRRVGNARVNFSSLIIEGDAGRYSMEPKVLEVLDALIESHGEVVSRDNLIDRVWGVDFGGDERLSRAISLLRKALGDRRGDHQHIETISKRGYRLIAPVDDIAPSGARPTPTLDNKLAILPFANIGGDPDSAFLAEGLCLDLTNLLSRVPEQKVAPHSSAIQYRESELSVVNIAGELGARYVVSGAFQRSDRDIRLRIQLTDAVSGDIIWSNKYDTRLDAFFELQDDIIRSIATTINSELSASAFKTVLDRPDFNLSVYEHIQAAEAERWTYNRAAAERIVAHLRAALAIKHDNVMALAGLIGQLSQNLVSRWTDDPAATVAEIQQHLKKAQAIDPNHPEILLAAGIWATMSGRPDNAVPYLERAAEIDPNNPHTRALLGWQRCALNKDTASIDLIRSAERDAPHHPRFAIWAHYRGNAECTVSNFEASLAAFEESRIRNPNYFLNLILRAHPLVMMGCMDEATTAIQEGLKLEPGYTFDQAVARIELHAFWLPQGYTTDKFIALLRRAWPEPADAADR